MYASVLRLSGNLLVVEREGFVSIKGINTRMFAKDIQKKWKTTRIAKYLFTVFKK